MKSKEIDEILDQIYPLPTDAKELIKQIVEEKNYPKGEIVLQSDKVERRLFFIKSGVVRAFYESEEKEVTFWFGMEGDTIYSMNSYTTNQKGYETIELLEDCTLYEICTSALMQLYKENIHIANWGRKYAEREFARTERRLISLQFKSAMERYEELLKQSPEILQRVQLGYIASYLGMSQVSLSRIRGKVK